MSIYSPQLHTFTSRWPELVLLPVLPEVLEVSFVLLPVLPEVLEVSFMAHPDRNRPAATLVARVKATIFFN